MHDSCYSSFPERLLQETHRVITEQVSDVLLSLYILPQLYTQALFYLQQIK